MLIRFGNDRSIQVDFLLAGLLSSIAGGLNAVGFLVAGSFTANMTGNISALADHLAKGQIVTALSFAGLVIAFICGAGLAALAIQIGLSYRIRSIYALAILTEAALLLVLGLGLVLAAGEDWAIPSVIALSFVMGLQNAVTTVISQARVRTTHVSGMATDIGIELAAMMADAPTRRLALPKLKLHSLTLVCFCIGGLCGAVLFTLVGRWIFVIAAASLAVIAGSEIWRASRG